MKKILKFAWCVVVLCIATGCHNLKSQNLLRIAASPAPHAELLYALNEDAKALGLCLKVLPLDDYRIPNRLLLDKQIDANYFQHEEFFQDECERYNCVEELVPLVRVHIEPMGLYSKKFSSVQELRRKGKLTIAIPVDRTNSQRALDLLESCELISFKHTSSLNATKRDVCTLGERKISIHEIAAPLLMSSFQDVDAAVIPGNFAITGGLSPQEDSLWLEDFSTSKYANIVVVRKEDLATSKIQKLKQLLQSDRVRLFFEETYKGNILTTPLSPQS